MTTADILGLRPLPLLCTPSTDLSLNLLDLLAFYPSAGRHLPAALLQQLPQQGTVDFYTEVFDGMRLNTQQSANLQIAFHPFLLRDQVNTQSFQWALYVPECSFSNLTISRCSSELQQASIWLDSDSVCQGAFPSLTIYANAAAAVFFSLCISESRSAVTRHVVILDNGYLATLVACLTLGPEPLDLRSNLCSDVFKHLMKPQSDIFPIEEYIMRAGSMHKLNPESASIVYRNFLVYLAWEQFGNSSEEFNDWAKYLEIWEKEAEDREEWKRFQAQLKLKGLVWKAVTELIRWLQLI